WSEPTLRRRPRPVVGRPSGKRRSGAGEKGALRPLRNPCRRQRDHPLGQDSGRHHSPGGACTPRCACRKRRRKTCPTPRFRTKGTGQDRYAQEAAGQASGKEAPAKGEVEGRGIRCTDGTSNLTRLGKPPDAHYLDVVRPIAEITLASRHGKTAL